MANSVQTFPLQALTLVTKSSSVIGLTCQQLYTSSMFSAGHFPHVLPETVIIADCVIPITFSVPESVEINGVQAVIETDQSGRFGKVFMGRSDIDQLFSGLCDKVAPVSRMLSTYERNHGAGCRDTAGRYEFAAVCRVAVALRRSVLLRGEVKAVYDLAAQRLHAFIQGLLECIHCPCLSLLFPQQDPRELLYKQAVAEGNSTYQDLLASAPTVNGKVYGVVDHLVQVSVSCSPNGFASVGGLDERTMFLQAISQASDLSAKKSAYWISLPSLCTLMESGFCEHIAPNMMAMFIADNGMASAVSKCCVDWLGTEQQVLLVPIDVAYLITMVFGHYPAEVYVLEALEKASECDFKVSDVSFKAQGQIGTSCFHVKFLGLTADISHGGTMLFADTKSNESEDGQWKQRNDVIQASYIAPTTNVGDSVAEATCAHEKVKAQLSQKDSAEASWGQLGQDSMLLPVQQQLCDSVQRLVHDKMVANFTQAHDLSHVLALQPHGGYSEGEALPRECISFKLDSGEVVQVPLFVAWRINEHIEQATQKQAVKAKEESSALPTDDANLPDNGSNLRVTRKAKSGKNRKSKEAQKKTAEERKFALIDVDYLADLLGVVPSLLSNVTATSLTHVFGDKLWGVDRVKFLTSMPLNADKSVRVKTLIDAGHKIEIPEPLRHRVTVMCAGAISRQLRYAKTWLSTAAERTISQISVLVDSDKLPILVQPSTALGMHNNLLEGDVDEDASSGNNEGERSFEIETNSQEVGATAYKVQLACAALDGVFFKSHLELAGQWLHQAHLQYETELKKERLSLHKLHDQERRTANLGAGEQKAYKKRVPREQRKPQYQAWTEAKAKLAVLKKEHKQDVALVAAALEEEQLAQKWFNLLHDGYLEMFKLIEVAAGVLAQQLGNECSLLGAEEGRAVVNSVLQGCLAEHGRHECVRYRRYEFKLYPTREQEKQMLDNVEYARQVYNALVREQEENHREYLEEVESRLIFGEARSWHEAKMLTVTPFLDWMKVRNMVTEFKHTVYPEWCNGIALSLAEVARNFVRAVNGFYARKNGKPRYKEKGKVRESFVIPEGFRFLQGDNHIKLPKMGAVKFRSHNHKLQGEPKTLTIFRSVDGWHMSVAYEQREQISHRQLNWNKAVGLDVGVVRFYTASDNSAHFEVGLQEQLKPYIQEINRCQRSLARKKSCGGNDEGSESGKSEVRLSFSKARDRVKDVLSIAYQKFSRARNDLQHKLAKRLADKYDIIVVEDLKITYMVHSAKGTIMNPGKGVSAKRGLNRSILFQAWRHFLTLLEYKLKQKGGLLIKVPARYTSQTCPCCGHVSSANRKTQSEFKCTKCGYAANADFVAAKNILRRGRDLYLSYRAQLKALCGLLSES